MEFGKMLKTMEPFLKELIGTFVLIAVISKFGAKPSGFLPISLTLMTCLLVLNGVSMNPALTLGQAFKKETTWQIATGLVTAQITGAIMARLMYN